MLERLAELDLRLGGDAVACSALNRLADGCEHLAPGVAKDHRSPGQDVVDVLVPVDVPEPRALGARDFRIILKHILPNGLSPILVSATMGVGGAILIESGLSFLGLGVQPPAPSWGSLLASGKDNIEIAWWLSAFPGLAILITVLGYNLLGEGIRDALDPRLRRGFRHILQSNRPNGRHHPIRIDQRQHRGYSNVSLTLLQARLHGVSCTMG